MQFSRLAIASEKRAKPPPFDEVVLFDIFELNRLIVPSEIRIPPPPKSGAEDESKATLLFILQFFIDALQSDKNKPLPPIEIVESVKLL